MLRKSTPLMLISLTTIGLAGPVLGEESSKEISADSKVLDKTGPDSVEPPPAKTAISRVSDREVVEAVERFKSTGDAAVLARSQTVVFPFGESQPEVRCTPLRACDIELQAGEIVLGVALGDAERWITSPLSSGNLERPTPHVIVKPHDYGLATNLVIATDRRTYHLSLTSPPKAEIESADSAYLRHVGFYYPQELVEQWAEAAQHRDRVAQRAHFSTVASVSAVSVDRLNFNYTVKGHRKLAWVPQTVFDDGEHVYIQLPPAARAADLPALLVEVEGGGMGISNYRVRDSWYIVDGLFERAELVVGVGRKRKRVEIINRSFGTGGS